MKSNVIKFPMAIPGRSFELDPSKPFDQQSAPGEVPLTPLPVKTFDALADIMPPTVITGLLRVGELLLIGGHSKKWKSWATLDLLYCVTNGLKWLGFETGQTKVAHIDLELLEADLKHRFNLIAESYGQGSCRELTIVPLRGRKFDFSDLLRLAEQLKDSGFGLISLDPTYRLLANRNESDAGVITDLLNHFLAFGTELGAAVCLLQHFAKGNASAKDPIDRFSGSGVWGRYPDALMTFTEHIEEKCFTVDFNLRSFPPLEPFGVRWEMPRFRIDEDLDPEKLKEAKVGRPKLSSAEQLASLIQSDEEISYSDLCRRAMQLSQISKSTFDRRLKEASKQKLIFQSKINGLYAIA